MGVATSELPNMVRSLSVSRHRIRMHDDIHLIQTLLDRGYNANAFLDGQKRAIHLCTNPLMMQALLEHHADVNAQDDQGNTALHLAALRNDLRMVQLLIEYGANGAISNHQGKRPAQLSSHEDIIWLITEALRCTGG